MNRQTVLGLAALFTLLLTGQPGAGLSAQFRTNTLAVRVDVLVTDGRKPVAGLTAPDFNLRDNAVPQSIELVDPSEVPLNVVLALDTSGSTDGARQTQLVAASEALLDGLTPRDRAALTTFSHAVTPRLKLTADLASVRTELGRISPSGRTAILDAVYVALTSTLSESGRSLVVICTDGSDISSWLQPEEVVEAAKRSNAVVYAVTSTNARRSQALEAITEVTGGDVLRVASNRELRTAFQKILQDFRSRYILSYTPTGVAPGGVHRIDVRVGRRGLTVKARPGYIGLPSSR